MRPLLLLLAALSVPPPPRREPPKCKKCGRVLVQLDTNLWQCSLDPAECRPAGLQ